MVGGGVYVEKIGAVIAVTSSIIAALMPYFIDISKEKFPTWYLNLDLFTCVYFLVQWLINLYLAQHKMSYILEIKPLV